MLSVLREHGVVHTSHAHGVPRAALIHPEIRNPAPPSSGAPNWAIAAWPWAWSPSLAPLELRPGPGPAGHQARSRPSQGGRLRGPGPALVEPLLTGTRPRKGANAFVVLADNSQSLLINDDGRPPPAATGSATGSRRTPPGRPGSARISTSATMPSTRTSGPSRASTPSPSTAPARRSRPRSRALLERFRGLPLAGVLLFTDGNRTDVGDLDCDDAPADLPGVPPSRGASKDVGRPRRLGQPDQLRVGPRRRPGRRHGRRLRGPVDRRRRRSTRPARRSPARRLKATPTASRWASGSSSAPRRRASASTGSSPSPPRPSRPRSKGTIDEARSGEQTLANNARLVVVDQGGGPYRVLYVSGRPNWEFKFLRRALQDDEQVQLVGLLRIAKRQPKFDFQAAGTRTTSPLFNGFDNADPDTAEGADQPVLVRLGTESTRPSCATASPRRPTSSTATTRSSSTTSKPRSSPRTSSPSCATS